MTKLIDKSIFHKWISLTSLYSYIGMTIEHNVLYYIDVRTYCKICYKVVRKSFYHTPINGIVCLEQNYDYGKP